MVKGTTHQVVVVKNPKGDLFAQAIFLLKDDPNPCYGYTERQILEEADRLSSTVADQPMAIGWRHRLLPFMWGGIGAGLMGLLWILTIL